MAAFETEPDMSRVLVTRLIGLALIAAVVVLVGFLFLAAQIEPIMCTGSGGVGPPAPTPAPPAPCPSGFR